jgi:hypothetical protein
MFIMWDDNHRLQAYMPYISRIQLEDLYWHIIVDSIMLNIREGLGANGTIWATPVCFLITFVTAFGKIILKYNWNILEKIFEKIFLNHDFFYSTLMCFILIFFKNMLFKEKVIKDVILLF